MREVTTEDCVSALVKAKGGSPSDWKRRSKKKQGDDIVRTFENVKTGETVDVVEKFGQIVFGPGAALRTFSVKVSKEELAGIIAYHWSKTDYFGHYFGGEPKKGMSAVRFIDETSFDGGKGLTPQVSGDLSVVQFDTENVEWHKKDAYGDFGEVAGFNTTPGGLTYLGVTAGGDWESPLLFILYWDGIQLRGYVPTDGNTWNTDTKTAYGSAQEVMDDEDKAEDAENKNAKKRFGVDDYRNAEPDAKKILADIDANIKFVMGDSAPLKGVNDIDWNAIEEIVKEEEANEKEFQKNQAARKSCDDPACSCRVITVGSAPAPARPAPQPVVISVNPDDIVKELVEAQQFLKGLDIAVGELRQDVLSNQPGVKSRAVGLRDGVLKQIVAKLVKATLAIEHMA